MYGLVYWMGLKVQPKKTLGLKKIKKINEGEIKMTCLPFNELTVLDLTEKGPTNVPGWTFNSTDLNSGVGGDFIYVGYETGDDNPITSITFKSYDQSQQDNPMKTADWEWNPIDLNRNAGGKFIYMFWKVNEPGNSPICNLIFTVSDQSSPYNIPGYVGINQDLNEGAGGPYIFAYYSTTVCPNPTAKVKMARS